MNARDRQGRAQLNNKPLEHSPYLDTCRATITYISFTYIHTYIQIYLFNNKQYQAPNCHRLTWLTRQDAGSCQWVTWVRIPLPTVSFPPCLHYPGGLRYISSRQANRPLRTFVPSLPVEAHPRRARDNSFNNTDVGEKEKKMKKNKKTKKKKKLIKPIAQHGVRRFRDRTLSGCSGGGN